MSDPIFWLGLSLLLVAVSLTAVLIAALPAFQEITRAARSIEKLCDTLRQEFPPALHSIRLTGEELSNLTGDINAGVKSTTQVVKQVDRSLEAARQQVNQLQQESRGLFAGLKAGWQALRQSPRSSNAMQGDSSGDRTQRRQQ